MSKLQKRRPNYTQVCTLAEPCGCLTGATGYAPGLSAPKRPVSVMAQNLWGIPSTWVPVLFSYLPAYYRGKAMRHENACLLRWPKLGPTTATAHQNLDKISGNRRDSETHTTGPTLTIVAPAIEG